jgi:hypothetical protein
MWGELRHPYWEGQRACLRAVVSSALICGGLYLKANY